MFRWKNFENRSIFGEDMDKSMWLSFFGPPCTCISKRRPNFPWQLKLSVIYRVAPKWQLFLYAVTSPNINQFSKFIQCQNQEEICITKDPTTHQVCRCTTLWNVSVLKAAVENKITTHFKKLTTWFFIYFSFHFSFQFSFIILTRRCNFINTCNYDKQYKTDACEKDTDIIRYYYRTKQQIKYYTVSQKCTNFETV